MCDSCQAIRINGILCHETGCPNTPKECAECGGKFVPGHRWETLCESCAESLEAADDWGPIDDDDDDDSPSQHTPAARIVPPIGNPLPTCAKCGIPYLSDDDDDDTEGGR
jgi:hypothetical protein